MAKRSQSESQNATCIRFDIWWPHHHNHHHNHHRHHHYRHCQNHKQHKWSMKQTNRQTTNNLILENGQRPQEVSLDQNRECPLWGICWNILQNQKCTVAVILLGPPHQSSRVKEKTNSFNATYKEGQKGKCLNLWIYEPGAFACVHISLQIIFNADNVDFIKGNLGFHSFDNLDRNLHLHYKLFALYLQILWMNYARIVLKCEHIWCVAPKCGHNSSGVDGKVDASQVFLCILPQYTTV